MTSDPLSPHAPMELGVDTTIKFMGPCSMLSDVGTWCSRKGRFNRFTPSVSIWVQERGHHKAPGIAFHVHRLALCICTI